jgi:hypothetical protein
VYAVRWLATFCVTTVLLAVATVALYLAIYWGTPELWGEVFPTRALWTIAATAVGQFGYCALFGFLGMIARRSLVIGVAYIASVEAVLANLDFVGRKLTVVYYVRTLYLRWLEPNEEWLRRWKQSWDMDLGTIPSARRCVLTIGLFGTIVTLLTAAWFARREFRVKTPGGG